MMSQPKEPAAGGSVETPYGWAIVAASCIVVSMVFAVNTLSVVSLKPMALSFGWPRWVPSASFAAMSLGAGIGGMVIGWFSDRIGVAKPLVFGAIAIAFGASIISQAQSSWVIIGTAALLIGFCGLGASFSPLIANATRWFDRRRGLAVSIIATGQMVGGAVWAPLFGWGIATYGWRPIWLFYAGIVLLTVLPAAWVLRPRPPQIISPPQAEPEQVKGRRRAVFDRSDDRLPLWLLQALLCLAIVGCCVAMALPMTHMVAYCSDLGFSAERGAEMISVLLLCGILSRLYFGWLSDKIGGLQTILIGAVLQALALGLYVVIDGLMGLYVISGLFGLAFGGIVPAYALAVRQLFPDKDAAFRIGLVLFFGHIGMGSGSVIGGAIFDLTLSYQPAFATGLVFNIVNIACIAALIYGIAGKRRLENNPSLTAPPLNA